MDKTIEASHRNEYHFMSNETSPKNIDLSCLRVDFLANAYHALNQISIWLNHEFLYVNPGETVEIRKKRMISRANIGVVPFCMVALLDKIPVATASIIECDMEIRSIYTPWLASVFTDKNYRNIGIGSLVCRTIVSELKKMNKYENVYLYTPDQEEFYRKMGWQTIERFNYKSKDIVIMKLLI